MTLHGGDSRDDLRYIRSILRTPHIHPSTRTKCYELLGARSLPCQEPELVEPFIVIPVCLSHGQATTMNNRRTSPPETDIISVPPESFHLDGGNGHGDGTGDDDSFLERMVPPDNAQPAMRPVSKKRQTTILLSAFLDVFVTIGLNQAYGVFLNYYLTDGSSGEHPFLPKSEVSSKAMLAFVGTLASGLTWGGSIFVNPIMARTKDPRWITGAGAVLIGAGYVLASFCHTVCNAAYRQICHLGKATY